VSSNNDIKHGKGIIIWKDGGKRVGTWANGKLNGLAQEYSPEGELLGEFQWKDGEEVIEDEKDDE
jgi:antitoxin component YwqK of YwqJK toxin-antitoxin module